MIVEELEDLLARCPSDLLVVVRSGGGGRPLCICTHIEAVTRWRAGQIGRSFDPQPPPTLQLTGRTMWAEPAPPWVVRGPWRGRADLPWEPFGGWGSGGEVVAHA